MVAVCDLKRLVLLLFGGVSFTNVSVANLRG